MLDGNSWGWVSMYTAVPVVWIVMRQTYKAYKTSTFANPFEGVTLVFGIASVLAVLTLWPLVVVWLMSEPLFERTSVWRVNRCEVCDCRPEHLLGAATVQDAEAVAVVVDPLDRVSALPFGHLHSAWLAFLEKKKAWYRLQKFHIPGNPNGGKSGYAWVKWGRVKEVFICEWD